MNPSDNSNTISSLNELKKAKQVAEASAQSNKELVAENLNDIKSNGSKVLLKDVVLPVVGMGVAIYGIAKLVGTLTDQDRGRTYYNEPQYEYQEHASPVQYQQNLKAQKNSLFSTANLMKFGPVALQVAKYGVDYLQKNGKEVPQFVHNILQYTSKSK